MTKIELLNHTREYRLDAERRRESPTKLCCQRCGRNVVWRFMAFGLRVCCGCARACGRKPVWPGQNRRAGRGYIWPIPNDTIGR